MDEVDDDRTVARIFHSTNVLPNDLLPILLKFTSESPRDKKVSLACADLVGAMTWPINVIDELKAAQESDEPKDLNVDFTGLL